MKRWYVVVMEVRVAVEIDTDIIESPSPFTAAYEASSVNEGPGYMAVTVYQKLVSEQEVVLPEENDDFSAWVDSLV